jgi:hypothetical protein
MRTLALPTRWTVVVGAALAASFAVLLGWLVEAAIPA